ncbi:transposase [Methylosinus sp. RM1]|uniref:transposase n=1 Tax=Methylosinus sp. RM1 TaxID=2583817 RepID=UPI00140DE872
MEGDAGSATRVNAGRPPRDHRRVIDDVLWIALTGGAWRELPAEYGNWSSVYRQFLRWSEGRPMAPSAHGAQKAPLQTALAAVCALPGRRAAR